jgi:PAS domain S-box-containing protein
VTADEPVNILLVDDQPAKLLSYEAILGELGETLIRAGSAREALERLLRNDVAVILIDVVMPDLDGFELATMIREHPRFERTAIIFVSAVHMTDLDRLRGYQVGAVDYVPVPVVPDLLRAKVRVFAELYRKTRQLERLNAELERRVAERTAALEAAAAQLRESERRRSLTLAAGGLGSWDWDTATGERLWDAALHRLYGMQPIEPAEAVSEFWKRVHVEDRDRLRATVTRTAALGEAYDVEFRMTGPDGAERWWIAAAAPEMDGTGRTQRMSGVTYDITARKAAEIALRESEERLRIAQETSGIGIWDWDLTADRIIWIGDVYRAWGLNLGRNEAPRAIFARVVHPDDQEMVWAAVQAALRGDAPYQVEFRIVQADGSVRWLAGKAEVFRDASGRPVRMVGTDSDVTERRRAAEVLAAANAELERRVEERTREREAALAQVHEMQKMESLGKLTGGVAHDFNNLLMAVLGNLSLLRKRLPQDPRLLKLLDGAVQGAERGATLTKRMLAFARRQELKPETVNLARLVEGMAELLRRSLGPVVDIVTGRLDDLPAVRVDPNQLELALLNLAVNARDAMPLGGRLVIGGRVSEDGVGAPPELAPGRYLCVSVSDTGTGMDEVTLKHATEPFFTTKGVGKGTGLGLSMVHGLAAQSGGAMRISSALGSGTTVELWLPVAEEAALVRHEPASATPDAAALPVSRPCRILVVDDDPLISAGTVAMLEDLGHSAVEVPSGMRALELLQGGIAVDLVITDHAMPGMTGMVLAQEIRQTWPHVPVLLATGYADLPEGEGAELPRLAKPYRQEDLAWHITWLLERARGANVVPIGAARRA